MAHEGDAESQTNVHEQTPLLDDDQQSSQQTVDDAPELKQARYHVWRIFWAIIAVLILAAFIKGWIDAGGDVQVSVTT